MGKRINGRQIGRTLVSQEWRPNKLVVDPTYKFSVEYQLWLLSNQFLRLVESAYMTLLSNVDLPLPVCCS